MRIGYYYVDTRTGEVLKCVDFQDDTVQFLDAKLGSIQVKSKDINYFTRTEDVEKIISFNTYRKNNERKIPKIYLDEGTIGHFWTEEERLEFNEHFNKVHEITNRHFKN